MWKSATLVLVGLAVLSCATPEQRQSATPQQRQNATPEQRKKRIAADQERIAAQIQRDLAPVCTSAGLIPGTDAHSHCIMSVVIGSLPQIAPKKHWVAALWQSRMRRRGRPVRQWCVLPAHERGPG